VIPAADPKGRWTALAVAGTATLLAFAPRTRRLERGWLAHNDRLR
jgi:hypothetical protein